MIGQAARTWPRVRLAIIDAWRHGCVSAALGSPGFGGKR